jgi:hypothetical protein
MTMLNEKFDENGERVAHDGGVVVELFGEMAGVAGRVWSATACRYPAWDAENGAHGGCINYADEQFSDRDHAFARAAALAAEHGVSVEFRSDVQRDMFAEWSARQ